MNEERYSGTERALVLLGLVFLVGAGALYFSGFSVQRYFLGWGDESGGRKVGVLLEREGKVRRQLGASTEFLDIDVRSDLFNEDTLVTSSEGGARFELEDGSSIELGPGTMVKLVFDSELSLQGISRRANIEVVTGNVSGVAKSKNVVLKSRNEVVRLDNVQKKVIQVAPKRVAPARPTFTPAPVIAAATPMAVATPTPTPTPTPTTRVISRVQVVSPQLNEVFEADPKLEEPAVTPVFEWLVAPLDQPLEIVVRKAGAKPKEIFRRSVTPNKGRASVSAKLDEPGLYEWELVAPEGSRLAVGRVASRFTVFPEIQRIETQSPLVGGSASGSNRYEGEVKSKFDGITLRWQPLPGATTYKIQLLKKPRDRKALLERSITEPSYSFNKGKLFTGTIYYKVLSPLPKGWQAVSEAKAFSFSYLPPALVIPENEAVITQGTMSRSDNSILMTWQRMNFTIGYELEIASDSEFKKVVQRHLSKENFMIIRALPPGRFWWRVRCYTKEISSPFSAPNLLVISP